MALVCLAEGVREAVRGVREGCQIPPALMDEIQDAWSSIQCLVTSFGGYLLEEGGSQGKEALLLVADSAFEALQVQAASFHSTSTSKVSVLRTRAFLLKLPF